MEKPRLKALNDAFKEAWEVHRKDPSNVHAHEGTVKELTQEIYGPQAKEKLDVIMNNTTGKIVRVREDDVPEGRYFFSDDEK